MSQNYPPMPNKIPPALVFLSLVLLLVPFSFCRVRENPNGGGFQVFESTNCNTLLRYGWGVRSPLQNQMFQTDVRRVYAAKLMEALPLE